MGENPKLALELNPGRLSAIVNAAIIATSEIVNFHFNALATADLNAPAEAEAMFRLRGSNMSAEQRRALHENWILAKAFQELLRAVRHTLEEAHVFTSLLTGKHTIKSNATLLEFLQPFQRKAAGLKFPDLLEAVNEHLTPKLEFADSYKSLQMARNCLEHRNGTVGRIETHGKELFTFSVPRMKIFYLRDGHEVEIAKGEKIEPGDDRAEVDVFSKLDVRKRTVPLGERLTFTLADFNEITFACYFLGQELSTKLPKPVLVG